MGGEWDKLEVSEGIFMAFLASLQLHGWKINLGTWRLAEFLVIDGWEVMKIITCIS